MQEVFSLDVSNFRLQMEHSERKHIEHVTIEKERQADEVTKHSSMEFAHLSNDIALILVFIKSEEAT